MANQLLHYLPFLHNKKTRKNLEAIEGSLKNGNLKVLSEAWMPQGAGDGMELPSIMGTALLHWDILG